MPRRSRLRILWHPHQKLWNWALVQRLRRRLGPGPLTDLIEAALIAADTALLAGRAGARRAARRTGRRTAAGGRQKVLYVDCGIHKEAEQVQWMNRWFGDRYELHVLAFEAGGEHFRDAAAALEGLERVRLHHLALVGPEHAGDEVRLYKTGGKGKADSLFETRGTEYETVPAGRLSAVIADEGWHLDRTPVIVRMNIEGAEQFVIDDLLAAGLAGSVDGYYGMWDDLSKLDPDADKRFQRLLEERGIQTLTFNDRDLTTFGERPLLFSPRELPTTLRDLAFRWRRHVIRGDIESAIEAGVSRTQQKGAGG